jgi:hypothetical protein
MGKFITFLLLTIFGGLLQLWVLWITLFTKAVEENISGPTFAQLIGDGVLFFFATSLVFSSFLTLVDSRSLKLGSADLNLSLVVIALVLLLATVTYVSVLTSAKAEQNNLPFETHWLQQVICAFAAVAYACYVGTVTGFFRD